MSKLPVLLLTGATGLIGKHLRPMLSCPGREVVALSRNCSHDTVRGDLRQPNLGLDSSLISSLQQRVTDIVHCAAETRFDLPLQDARASNCEGLRHLLQFAQGCPNLHRFTHVSTLYIAGRRPGVVAEAALTHDAGFFSTYEQSKYEAEHVIAAEGGSLPISIVRLSSVIGHSVTGRVDQFNYFHQLIRLVPDNPLPIIPGDPEAPVDLIPTDWTAAALHSLHEHSFTSGSVRHLCAGARDSMSVGELVDWAFRSVARHTLRPPRFVSVSEFDEFLSHAERSGKMTTVRIGRALSTFLPHLGVSQPFANTETRRLLPDLPVPCPRQYLPRIIDYGRSTNWGRTAVQM